MAPDRRRLLGFGLAASAAVLLAGCASLAPGPGVGGGEEAFGGRFSVRYVEAGSQAEKGLQGNFRWHEAPGRTTIDLSSPLGNIIARIQVSPAGAVLETASGERREAADVDALTQEGLGWRLPVAGLRYWLRGEPAPGSTPAIERGAGGRPKTLEQDGWRIEYLDYAAAPSGERPSRMAVDYVGQGAGRVQLRLALQYE